MNGWMVFSLNGIATLYSKHGTAAMPMLESNHKEAHNYIILHASQLRSTLKRLVVLVDDADVFVLLVYFYSKWQQQNLVVWRFQTSTLLHAVAKALDGLAELLIMKQYAVWACEFQSIIKFPADSTPQYSPNSAYYYYLHTFELLKSLILRVLSPLCAGSANSLLLIVTSW